MLSAFLAGSVLFTGSYIPAMAENQVTSGSAVKKTETDTAKNAEKTENEEKSIQNIRQKLKVENSDSDAEILEQPDSDTDTTLQQSMPESATISSFDDKFDKKKYALNEAPDKDTLSAGLPSTLTVTVSGGSEERIPVASWESGDYDKSVPGEYTFTPVLDDVYDYSNTQSVPWIEVCITKNEISNIQTVFEDQSYALGKAPSAEEIEKSLPNTLTASVNSEGSDVPILSWNTDYDSSRAGVYTFTPALDNDVYSYDESELPYAVVTLQELSAKKGMMRAQAVQGKVTSIGVFAAQLVSGAAKNTKGDYVWKAISNTSGHRFTFRVNYSTSGQGTVSGNTDGSESDIKITIPKTILKNRSGDRSDYYEMSLPERNELAEMGEDELRDNTFAYYEVGNNIVVYNFKPLDAAQNGYFEVAYITSSSTYNYKDYGSEDSESSPFQAAIEASGLTKTTDPFIVHIDTTASINSTYVYYPDEETSWNIGWGPKPSDADDYVWQEWEIRSDITDDPTQFYNFTLTSEVNCKEAPVEVYGYKFSGNRQVTRTNQIQNISTYYGYRYDYVYTRIKKTDRNKLTSYTITNKVTATIHPADGVDEDSSAVSTRKFAWTLPVFIHPIGHFYIRKYGNENGFSGDYASYELDKFQEAKTSSIDNIGYRVWAYGWPFPWTLRDGGSSDNPYDYGYKDVTYQITDEAFYNLNIDGTYGGSKQKFAPDYTNGWETEKAPGENGEPLTPRMDPEDYDISYVSFSAEYVDVPRDENGHLSEAAGSLNDNMEFRQVNINPTDKDILTFWTRTGTEDYVKAGEFNLGTEEITLAPDSLISSIDTDNYKVHFKDGVDGFRVTTSNNHYYTSIELCPYISIKNSTRMLDWTGTGIITAEGSTSKDAVLIRNVANLQIFDSNGKRILDLTKTSGDRLRRSERTSEISKIATGSSSNRKKKQFTVSWKVNADETFITGTGNTINSSFVTQSSGVFYDLLPAGALLLEDSVDVAVPFDGQSPTSYAWGGRKYYLPSNAYTVTTTDNFRNTGRTLLTVRIKDPGACYSLYYQTVHSWDTVADYGKWATNPVAYETGNEEISGGFPDDPNAKNLDNVTMDQLQSKRSCYFSSENRFIYKDMDPDTDEYKFLYDECSTSFAALTAASAGLNKRVRANSSSTWDYIASVKTDEAYTYRLRFANVYVSAVKDMILYDSIENYYKTDGAEKGKSAWYGSLTHIDTTQMEKVKSFDTETWEEKSTTLKPVIYISAVDGLDLDIESNKDLSNTSVWTKLSSSTDLSKVKAVAYDLRKDSAGNDFILKPGGSVASMLYMESPHTITGAAAKQYPETYNNVYLHDTVIGTDGSLTPYDIHYDYTTVRYAVTASFGLHKVSAKDPTQSIRDIQFRLFGTSDYGTEVDKIVATDKNGDISFKNIEKGSYVLQEYSGTPDWLEDHTEHKVVIDGNAKVTIDGIDYTDKFITIQNNPRIHTDIYFFKRSTTQTWRSVAGAVFKLSGTSDYGNDVLMFASSDDNNGKITFENVERGTYELKEVNAPDGYIKNDTVYTAEIDENGNFSIKELQTDSNGTYDILNEPYHSFTILKKSSYDNGPLGGAEFHLTGTSNYGTKVDTRITTDSILGTANFEHLESGTYILEESKGVDGYIKSNAKWIVTIKPDGTVEIPDLASSTITPHAFICVNTKIPNDEVVVVKRWVDDDQNTDHRDELPTIHLESTGVETLTGSVDWADNSGSYGALKYVTSDLSKISGFQRNTSISNTSLQSLIDSGKAVRLDNDRDNADAQYKIYGWLDDNNVLNWWSNAYISRLTDSSNQLFTQLRSCKDIDLSWIDTSGLTNMRYMFVGLGGDLSNDGPAVDLSCLNTSNVTDMSFMFYYSNVRSVNLDGVNIGKVTTMVSMFEGCRLLETVDMHKCKKGGNEKLDQLTDLMYMFKNDDKLESVDMSGLGLNYVTRTERMFQWTPKITSINFDGDAFESVTDAVFMFQCKSMERIDTSAWNMRQLQQASWMFDGCDSLKYLDLTGISMEHIDTMPTICYGATKLEYLNISNWDLSNIQSGPIGSIFGQAGKDAEKCEIIADGIILSPTITPFAQTGATRISMKNSDWSHVQSANQMFANCSRLKSLDVTNKTNVNQLQILDNMFENDASLENLDFTWISGAKLTSAEKAFSGATALTGSHKADLVNVLKTTTLTQEQINAAFD